MAKPKQKPRQSKRRASAPDTSRNPYTVRPWIIRSIGAAILIIAAVFAINAAFAQSSDWVEPATDIIEEISSGMQLLGGAVIGVGIVVIGIMGAVAGRINWQWLIALIVGGALIFSGGTAVDVLLGQ